MAASMPTLSRAAKQLCLTERHCFCVCVCARALQLVDVADGSLEFAAECAVMLRDAFDERLPMLASAARAQQLGDLYKHAHFLASSCGQMGFKNLLSICRAIEAAAKQQSADAAAMSASVAGLVDHYGEVRRWLHTAHLLS